MDQVQVNNLQARLNCKRAALLRMGWPGGEKGVLSEPHHVAQKHIRNRLYRTPAVLICGALKIHRIR
jgi:hypothetical protein